MSKKYALISKTVFISVLICLSAASWAGAQQTKYTTDDYNLAMRMTLKFFGGQRCGNTHNWMLVNNPNIKVDKTCHLGDKYNGHDVSGGWHDCGDHIKVATTMGYAAVALLTAYDVWPKAFEDDHDQNYGPANGIADVLDEVKIATDFFMKSFPDDKTFVYYVGDGSYDHTEWVTSAYQSTRPVEKGGDPRPAYAATDKGGAQAANYASALALMAMHYPDKAYAAQCSTAAIKIHAFARKNPDNINIPGFYDPTSEVSDEHGLMCILLYKLTGDVAYKDEAIDIIQNKWESNYPLAFDTVADILYYYLVRSEPNITNDKNNQYSVPVHDFIRKNVQSGISGTNSYGIPWKWFRSTWGTNKLASGSAFAAALYAKLVDDGVIGTDGRSGTTTAKAAYAYNARIIDYMLGNNEFNHTFIHGYKGDMYHKVHHRNAMGRDDNPPTATKDTAAFLFASGALIGGPATEGVFGNKVEGGGNAFVETESGCDYNAPFVAALANIIESIDPKKVVSVTDPTDPKDSTDIKDSTALTDSSTSVKYSAAKSANSRMSIKLTHTGLTLKSITGERAGYAKLEIFDVSGRKIYSSAINNKSNGVTTFTKPLPPAVYLVKLSGPAGVRRITAVVR